MRSIPAPAGTRGERVLGKAVRLRLAQIRPAGCILLSREWAGPRAWAKGPLARHGRTIIRTASSLPRGRHADKNAIVSATTPAAQRSEGFMPVFSGYSTPTAIRRRTTRRTLSITPGSPVAPSISAITSFRAISMRYAWQISPLYFPPAIPAPLLSPV